MAKIMLHTTNTEKEKLIVWDSTIGIVLLDFMVVKKKPMKVSRELAIATSRRP